MIVIISGPQGCGKTRRKEELLRHFNASRIVDDWMPGDTLKDGDVALTYFTPQECKTAANFPKENVFFYDFLQVKSVLTGGDHGLRK